MTTYPLLDPVDEHVEFRVLSGYGLDPKRYATLETAIMGAQRTLGSSILRQQFETWLGGDNRDTPTWVPKPYKTERVWPSSKSF